MHAGSASKTNDGLLQAPASAAHVLPQRVMCNADFLGSTALGPVEALAVALRPTGAHPSGAVAGIFVATPIPRADVAAVGLVEVESGVAVVVDITAAAALYAVAVDFVAWTMIDEEHVVGHLDGVILSAALAVVVGFVWLDSAVAGESGSADR